MNQAALCIILACVAGTVSAAELPRRPNIVFILADDLGYGDVRCFNPEGKIATPNIDRLAREGIMVRDAHSGSAVCSPTRYGIMTGRYCWRTRLKQHVLGGLSPRLIEPGRATVASMLKGRGYHTACVGKWHLGMDWEVLPGKSISELSIETPDQVANVDYAKPITNGPNSVGFDYYFGISGSLDMVPYTFIENDRVTVVPTREAEYPLMLGRDSGKTRLGPSADGFDATDVLPTLTREAVEYIAERAADARNGRPFFLYLPLSAPHSPILPAKEWRGASGLNPYADFVMATDAAVGAVLAALDEHHLNDNTLVIVTSDNGCSPLARFDELLPKGHNPSAAFRGVKADIYEGGHRVPFVARWPGVVRPGRHSEQLICLGDLFATCAEIIGASVAKDSAEDSISFLSSLTGTHADARREAIVHHSINGSFAIRRGNWKLCLCPDSGGWSEPRPGTTPADAPQVQLFDLAVDLGETANVAREHPEVVKELRRLLDQYRESGRSTP